MVMPFVSVTSKGGPHDDESYVAGYEMGLLDACLSQGGKLVKCTVRTSNTRQADLLAMRHGYTMAKINGESDWSYFHFLKVEEE